LIKSLSANREATLNLVKKIAENTSAQIENNKSILATKLTDKFKDQGVDKENREALTNAYARGLSIYTEKAYQDTWKKNRGDTKDKDVQKAYAEAMGWDTTTIKNKAGNKATYYDKEGNVVAEDLSDEVARRYLAQTEALDELTKITTTLSGKF
jgi:hypothetical protein